MAPWLGVQSRVAGDKFITILKVRTSWVPEEFAITSVETTHDP
jgi:hypothetical protein